MNGSFSSIHFRHALRSSLRKLSNAVPASLWRGKCIFPAVRGFIFYEKITYPPGVVRKHPKTTFQLFRRLRYWEFYKRTKTLRIRAYGSLRYAVPKNVNFSNGNNRFRVIESEVNFRRGVKKLLKKLPS